LPCPFGSAVGHEWAEALIWLAVAAYSLGGYFLADALVWRLIWMLQRQK